MRNRKYKGDYGHQLWKRNPRVWMIGFAIDWRGDDQDELYFVFHGAFKKVLTLVFDRMKRLFGSYEIAEDFNWDFLQGRCYRSMEVRINEPDFGLMSVEEWPMMISHYLKRVCLCEVTYFKDFNRFLNA